MELKTMFFNKYPILNCASYNYSFFIPSPISVTLHWYTKWPQHLALPHRYTNACEGSLNPVSITLDHAVISFLYFPTHDV